MDRLIRTRRQPIKPAPPPQRRAFSVIKGPVETQGSANEAAVLSRLFSVDAHLERALTHGFHSYAGRLHPSIARGAIAHFSVLGAKVLDPFCGSGTVLVESMAAGRAATGIDASPLAVMIARVRSRPLNEAGRRALVERAHEIAENAGDLARKRTRPTIPPWGDSEFKRYHAHVAFELFGLRELVMATKEDEIGVALRLCLSSLLVKFMRSGLEAPRDGADKRIARGIPSRFLADRAEELARGLAELESVTPPGTLAPRVTLGDARDCSAVETGSIDLVLSSPPYAGVYDYADHHAVRFRWLGLKNDKFKRIQLGEREEGDGAAGRTWQAGRRRWLIEMGRVLKPNGNVILVVGDGVVGDRAEDAAVAVGQEAPNAGLSLIAGASQARPTREPALRAIFGPRFRHEHILLLRKAPVDNPAKPARGPRPGPAASRPTPGRR